MFFSQFRILCSPAPLAALAAAAGMLGLPTHAESPLLPVHSVKSVNYDLATGQMSADNDAAREAICWSSTRTSGFFTSFAATEVPLDWGDLDADCCLITCFTIGYATDSSTPIVVDLILSSDDNGFDTITRVPLVGFRLSGLPGGVSGPGIYNGWLVTFTLASPIDMSDGGMAADLDGDGLKDFSYSLNFRTVGDPAIELAGPLIADADPNVVPFPAPGIEDAFDLFVVDPNSPPGPNDLLIPDINTLFAGTFWYGGPPGPFAQYYFELGVSATDPNEAPVEIECVECPFGNCVQPELNCVYVITSVDCGLIGDLNGDGAVDINDLAVQLANFGTPAGAAFEDGDIEPPGGDGDVDIVDLAVLLANFGTRCPVTAGSVACLSPCPPPINGRCPKNVVVGVPTMGMTFNATRVGNGLCKPCPAGSSRWLVVAGPW